MKTFRELLFENTGDINTKNIEGLEDFFKKQKGFESFEIDKDSGYLFIEFSKNIEAVKAVQKSQKSNNEIGAYGDVQVGSSKITVELSDEVLEIL